MLSKSQTKLIKRFINVSGIFLLELLKLIFFCFLFIQVNK
ncbi:hypothetical protein LEP1GSC082_4286 [Leptospira kirschneri str. H2]|uniref:Uncharacterized protein n=2 Tax=Leptospira kirschneri TaxID=29507 RepID=A0A0E2AXR7_9LEPT|nr:hypothetical protein LEP1GSC081_2522 [Leptospira kirschneri str. H1]EKO62719.1 hypothetical protein LEP1GSC082_4286 [Leptospira kirschneri str. H2]EMK24403.1 hypothetical protein LEP1GSC008_3915 [Leptospira kirschneri serovar Bulgarica str. Nikolaevo]